MNLERAVKEYKNGNEAAFQTLYKETFEYARVAIYTYVQDSDTIEDLLQDTFMKVTSRIQDYSEGSFKNWVYSIAKNIALDYIRSKRAVSMNEEIEVPDAPKNPYLRFALHHLPELEREVFLLKVLLGHTTKRVAEALGLSIKEVNTLYYSAKDTLRRELESYEAIKI